MTTPKLANTRPAALTGRVRQGGDNRIHDVAHTLSRGDAASWRTIAQTAIPASINASKRLNAQTAGARS